MGFSLQSIDRVKLEKILNKPWTVDGQTFTARCWTDKARLVEAVNQELTRMVATGASPKKAIENISKQFGTSKSNASKLIMTESAYFATASQGECYKDLDVKNYEVVGTLDSHTCSFCGEMDGQVFPVNKMQAGSTAPPFHPWCRCTTAPYYEDMVGVGQRFARDIETGKAYYLPSDTTYEQWKELQEAKYGEGSVDKARKMAYNENKDRELYNKYLAIFKEEFPQKFEDFQKLKYFDESAKWKDFIKNKQDTLNKLNFSDMKALKGSLGNKEVRLWYKAKDNEIPSLIDASLPLKEQAKQACDYRNTFRTQARELMKDQEARKELDVKYPNKSFEDLIEHKIKKYGMTEEEAYKDIIRSSKTTNADFDKKAGVKND